MLRAALSHREEDHHASQCSHEHVLMGITSPKASWRDNSLNPLWKDSWAVGTSGGVAGDVTAGRAEVLGPEEQVSPQACGPTHRIQDLLTSRP